MPLLNVPQIAIPKWTAWSTVDDLRWQIYYGPEAATGSNFGNGNNTLTKADAGWDDTGNGEHEGRFVTIRTGDGAGGQYEILSNTADTLTIDGNWSHDPNGQDFQICDEGDGTTKQTSGIMSEQLTDYGLTERGPWYVLAVEVEFSLRRLHGPDGSANTPTAIVELLRQTNEGMIGAEPTNYNLSNESVWFGGCQNPLDSLVDRRPKYYFKGDGYSSNNSARIRCLARVYAKARHADVGWEVVNIRARLLYSKYIL